jgi:hypothetical protein
MYPFILAIPRCVVYGVPCMDPGKPSLDGFPCFFANIRGDKGREESIGGWHTVVFWDIPSITELGESFHPCGICGSHGGKKSRPDCQTGCRSER